MVPLRSRAGPVLLARVKQNDAEEWDKDKCLSIRLLLHRFLYQYKMEAQLNVSFTTCGQFGTERIQIIRQSHT